MFLGNSLHAYAAAMLKFFLPMAVSSLDMHKIVLSSEDGADGKGDKV